MSEQKASGVVFRKTPKKWNDKTFYSFKFDGQDGYYRLGEDDYAGTVEDGYTINIGYETDGKGNNNVVPGHVKLVKKGEPVAATGGKGGGGKSNYSGGNSADKMSKQEWAEKDLTIQYQAARNSALAHVELLLKTESVKLPGKTKFAERQTEIDGLVDQYTARFFTDVAGREAVNRAGDEFQTQASLPAETEDDGPNWDDDDDTGGGGEWD